MPDNITEVLNSDLQKENKYSIIFLDGITGSEINRTTSVLEDPYALDLSGFLPGGINLDLEALYVLCARIVTDVQEKEGVIESKRVEIIKEWAPDNIQKYPNGEVITVSLIERYPSKMSRDGKSRPQYGSNFDHSFSSPEYPSNVIIVDSTPKDHIIEFCCWATSAKLADARALWLEKVLIKEAWKLKQSGAERWRFETRLNDTVMKHAEVTLHKRPLRFFVRLREYDTYIDPQIRTINFGLRLT